MGVEATNFIQLISTVGFPIVACVYMAMTNNKTIKEHSETLTKLTSSIQDNTSVIKALWDRLDRN